MICEHCEQLDQVHPDHDPSPWCQYCGAQRPKDCDCVIAENN